MTVRKTSRMMLIGGLFAIIGVTVSACQQTGNRLNMVADPASGLRYGSVIEKSIFVDPEQFEDDRIKVTIRNTSGDTALDVHDLKSGLERAYGSKGYDPVDRDFGLKLDLNVVYSGHIQRDMSTKYGFLGAAAGGIAGYRSSTRAGTAIGVLAGATLGSIIGATQTVDTYIVVAEVALGVRDGGGGKAGNSKTVVFGSSPKKQETRKRAFKPFRGVIRTKVAVYGGGRNVTQAQIIGEVRRRLIRIVGDVI